MIFDCFCLHSPFPAVCADCNCFKEPDTSVFFLYNPFDLVQVNQPPAQDSKARGTALAYLEEALQPPHLEDTLSHQDYHLEYAPPLDSAVCTLCRISMGPLANNNIRLLIPDLGKELR
jgi:hypothetical protein